MAVTDKTFDEVLNSLNGFDEIALEKATGKTLDALIDGHKILMMRAVVAIDISRTENTRYQDAYQKAMLMPMGEIPEYFTEPPDEVMPETPDSELGKEPLQPE